MKRTFETAALFDFDGVIVDSESQYTVFWQLMEQVYPTGIPDYAHAIKGTNLESILRHYPSAEIRDDIVDRLHRYEADMEYPVYDGVINLLDELGQRGVGRAIVTSSDDYKMGLVFGKLPWLRESVDVIIDGTMVTHGKPHPEGYLKAAAALGCEPCNCVVFEDSIQGLQAGRASGAAVVALATTNPVAAVEPLADMVFDSLSGFSADMLTSLLDRN